VLFDILGLIVVGLIIGALARLLLPGRQKIGLVLTLLLGVLGALIGGTVASALGTGEIFELNVIGFLVAVLASVGLLAVAEAAGIGAPRERRGLERDHDRRLGR
jgi:uncharacterized membrane protein YeaQ/YmgE (transglycosylase-associated protein family)